MGERVVSKSARISHSGGRTMGGGSVKVKKCRDARRSVSSGCPSASLAGRLRWLPFPTIESGLFIFSII